MLIRLKFLLYGAGAAAGALALSWFLNSVFQRSWAAVALILLAMLVTMLLQRMVAGGIPDEPRPDKQDADRPRIREETTHLNGIDRRYAWMALPSTVTFTGVLISMVV